MSSREQDELGKEQWDDMFAPDWPFTESPKPPKHPISDEELVADFLSRSTSDGIGSVPGRAAQ